MYSNRLVRASIIEAKLEELYAKGVVMLPGEIELTTSITLMVDLLHQSMFAPISPIWIVLNSPGGAIIQGLAIYDTIKMMTSAGKEVNVVGIGNVASMAVCIMQAATRRYAFPNTQFMVHQASVQGGEGSEEVNVLKDRAKEVNRQNNIVLNLIAEGSGMDLVKLRKISVKKDVAISAQEAKVFGSKGLVDEIITTLPFLLDKTA